MSRLDRTFAAKDAKWHDTAYAFFRDLRFCAFCGNAFLGGVNGIARRCDTPTRLPRRPVCPTETRLSLCTQQSVWSLSTMATHGAYIAN
jgi:hypothetical protein